MKRFKESVILYSLMDADPSALTLVAWRLTGVPAVFLTVVLLFSNPSIDQVVKRLLDFPNLHYPQLVSTEIVTHIAALNVVVL